MLQLPSTIYLIVVIINEVIYVSISKREGGNSQAYTYICLCGFCLQHIALWVTVALVILNNCRRENYATCPKKLTCI